MKSVVLPVLTALVLFLFPACKKDYSPVETGIIKASDNSNAYISDGVLSAQLGILPPATPSSFIANGGTSIVQYQLTSTKALIEVDALFDATYPAINYVWFSNYGRNQGTFLAEPFSSFQNPGSQVVTGTVYYNPVDSFTSGTIAQIKMNHLWWVSYDNFSNNFDVDTTAGASPDMCLVYNIAHIRFQNPVHKTLPNGYSLLAQIKLTGDTSWTLSALPLSIYSQGSSTSSPPPIVKSGGVKIPTTSGSITWGGSIPGQTVVNFIGGFKHVAGKKEILNIYAKFTYTSVGVPIYVTMQLLSGLVWTDGVGKILDGTLNARYYKEDTGESAVYFY
jgi:hypothetical protein